MAQIRWTVGVSELNGSEITNETEADAAGNGILTLGENCFRYQFNPQSENGCCSFSAASAQLSRGRCFLAAELPDYRSDWFVMIPSACYDGNRFQMQKITGYPPKFLGHVFPEDPMHPEIVMKEIPSLGNGFNRMITDASAPIVGVFMPERRQAFFLSLEQDTELGNNGIELDVTQNSGLRILISLPCVRRKEFTAYSHLDAGPELKTGSRAGLHFQTRFLPAADFADFYRAFAQIRSNFPVQNALRNRRSFSHAEEILRTMFEEVRWTEECNFYTKARGQQRIDVGWVTYPELPALFHNGSADAKRHVLKQLDHFFTCAPLQSGFFKTVSIMERNQTVWPEAGNLSKLVRQQCEILFYSLRLFRLFDLEHVQYSGHWKKCIRNLADALQSHWRKYHQFGFLLDLSSGELLVGGSFSGAMAPAALASAADYFHEPGFLRTAEESAHGYCEELRRRGFTYGGPGDALFTPDSESAFSLLESLVTLFEQTQNREWLEAAEFCADYCSSWVPAVKYKFTPGSTFDRMDMDCRGAVQANLQNQHGAPAPCIGSANSLFRLYRYSGNPRHLEMLRDIVHNSVQYLSTERNPIPFKQGATLPPGDICEKVFFQDYGNSVGEIPCGSGGWTEIAVLLCITENPGIYCCPEQKMLMVFDHVDASLSGNGLTLTNVFDYPVSIRIFFDSKEKSRLKPDFLPFPECETVHLKAHETASVKFPGN